MIPDNSHHALKVGLDRFLGGQDQQQVSQEDLQRQHIGAQLDLGLGRGFTHFSFSVGSGSLMESRVGGGGQTASADEGAAL
ncbi:hypothetical protein J2X45_003380 [Caulobacter sp. BE264]|uniref:hypothetical protein n=1 Tax=Caulobacter sp. BE264 TaxID=2817724 RepID=UPI00285CFE09|nr:hypothetical protein [Caulobacter sp. BE264]MDR7232274.1 hypothetical protein [Caulobacter sp. BE264]